jgi:flagellar basal body-associated protein FliL
MKRILVILVALAGAAGMYGYFQMNKPLKDIASGSATAFQAASLMSAYTTDEAKATTDYNDKIIEVSGTVASVSKNDVGEISVNLQSGTESSFVVCSLDGTKKHDVANIKEGDNVTIKGNCTGILGDIILNRCVLVK